MKKEEFLAISLPFDLVIAEINDDGVIVRNSRLYPSRYHDFATHDYYKPILHPLSDLTKPIEHNGEKFVPIDNIEGLFIEGTEDLINQSIEAIEYFIENNFFSRMEYLPFILIQKLIEWKFDLFGGIDSGDAIDVNTLTENPYK